MSDRVARYLERRADLESWPLECRRTDGVSQVVVIPAYAESEYLDVTLDSLETGDDRRLRQTLVIVVANNPPPNEADPTAFADNQATLGLLRCRARSGAIRLGIVDASTHGRALPPGEGAGLARKIGLDHGAAILLANGAPAGCLCCLDADSPVAPPYLQSASEHIRRHGWGAIVGFEHPLPDAPEEAKAILDYELYLRYHAIALQRAGSPYGVYAIGSTIACTAEAYAAVSGMNRRRAGEDFYFLQELIKTGVVYPLPDTLVFPSARVSRRTPFGTGRAIEAALATSQFQEAYHPEVYRVLAQWLTLATESRKRRPKSVLAEADAIHPALKPFLEGLQFERNMTRLHANAASDTVFRQQFHRWFDGLKTLRLIHALRDAGLANVSAPQAARALLKEAGESARDSVDNLETRRELNNALERWWREHARPCGVAAAPRG